jgi:hypothetical protein
VSGAFEGGASSLADVLAQSHARTGHLALSPPASAAHRVSRAVAAPRPGSGRCCRLLGFGTKVSDVSGFGLLLMFGRRRPGPPQNGAAGRRIREHLGRARLDHRPLFLVIGEVADRVERVEQCQCHEVDGCGTWRRKTNAPREPSRGATSGSRSQRSNSLLGAHASWLTALRLDRAWEGSAAIRRP